MKRFDAYFNINQNDYSAMNICREQIIDANNKSWHFEKSSYNRHKHRNRFIKS